MADLEIIECDSSRKQEWNEFVQNSNNGTVFHNLTFLSYHGDKFKNNEHHLIWLEDGSIRAVMPMGIFEVDRKRVAKSPYGASWGGIVYSQALTFEKAQTIVELLVEYLRRINVSSIVMTLPPKVYEKFPSDYIEFHLINNKFSLYKAALTSVIEITEEPLNHFTRMAKKAVRKAQRESVVIQESNEYDVFYSILLRNRSKFGARPTHTLDDMKKLCVLFPHKFKLFMAHWNGIPIAGSWIFVCNDRCILDFYWAHLEEYQHLRPINFLVYEITRWAFLQKIKWFDFGTITANMVPNLGGTQFKESFNARGIFRNTYWREMWENKI